MFLFYICSQSQGLNLTFNDRKAGNVVIACLLCGMRGQFLYLLDGDL